MEKVVRIFRSFEEADKADREMYRNMTPQERLQILLVLLEMADGPTRGLARVYRVVKRGER